MYDNSDNEEQLTHVDNYGNPRMVDVSSKKPVLRVARAIGYIKLDKKTIDLISDNKIKKGNVLTIAEIAGINGTKKTGEIIPLCHNIPLTNVFVNASLSNDCVIVESEVKTINQTGVEMEALMAVNIALLTIYDMCKSVDKDMEITSIKLISKEKYNT